MMKYLWLGALIAISIPAFADRGEDEAYFKSYIDFFKKADADVVSVLISRKFVVVRRNNGSLDTFRDPKEKGLIEKLARAEQKHIVLTNFSGHSLTDRVVNQLLDDGLKKQGFTQKTVDVLNASDETPPTNRAETLYTCALGFGFSAKAGSDKNLNHNYLYLLNNDKLLVVNRKGTAQFLTLDVNYPPFKVRPVDENRSFPIVDPRSPEHLDENTTKGLHTERTVLSNTDAEIALQSAMMKKAKADQQEKRIPSSPEKPLDLQKLIASYKACSNLNNGTITKAAELEIALIEKEQNIVSAELRSIFSPVTASNLTQH